MRPSCIWSQHEAPREQLVPLALENLGAVWEKRATCAATSLRASISPAACLFACVSNTSAALVLVRREKYALETSNRGVRRAGRDWASACSRMSVPLHTHAR